MLNRFKVDIDIGAQRLDVLEDGLCVAQFPVSTSKFGAGELKGSFKTPRGMHIVRAKIGADQPRAAVFVGRRPTGEICTQELVSAQPGRDWILTRILWLSGIEPGRNRLGDVDTMRRFIYIHGTPDSVELGSPGSIGCVRVSNDAALELFELIPLRTVVEIRE